MWLGDNNSGKAKRSNIVVDILMSFFSSTFDLVESGIEAIIEEQGKKILKKVSVLMGFIMGGWFLLNAIANFISEYLREGNWVGQGIVGGVIILLTLIFRK